MRISIESGSRSHFSKVIQAVRDAEAPRTGLHLSAIIHDIRSLSEAGNGRKKTAIADPTMLAFQEVGNAVEDILATAMQARYPGWLKPDPRLSAEGIICSPDGYSPRINCIDECKVAWKSYKDFIAVRSVHGNLLPLQEVIDSHDSYSVATESEKFFYYKLQVLFYMSVWGATRGRLHVLFVNGNYQPPFPTPVTFVMKPEPSEIAAMHQLIVQHATDRGMLPCQPPAHATVA